MAVKDVGILQWESIDLCIEIFFLTVFPSNKISLLWQMRLVLPLLLFGKTDMTVIAENATCKVY